MKVKEAAGKRFLLVESSPWFKDVAKPLQDKFIPLGWPVTQKIAPDNPDAYISVFDNAQSKKILKIKYTSLDKTVVDMADKMIEVGMITKPESA